VLVLPAAPNAHLAQPPSAHNPAHPALAVNIALMMSAGFFVNGPYALITTAVSADLGTHKSLAGGWVGGLAVGGSWRRLGRTDQRSVHAGMQALMHRGGTPAVATATRSC
jgi:hypothetical protein